MKTAICYYSRHHGNTRKVLEAMAQEGGVDLMDVTTRQAVRLEAYDCIGFASGVYFGKFHDSVLNFARQYLPEGKPVFFVCTYGAGKGRSIAPLKALAAERRCAVLGVFGCKGYDTFGPFRLVGGVAKGHPDGRDLDKARGFYRQMRESAAAGTGDGTGPVR